MNKTRPTESVSPNDVCLQCVINELARTSEGQPVGKQEDRNATTKFTDHFSWKLGKLFQRRRREELAARIGRGRRHLETEAKKFEDVANEVEGALASKAGEHPEAEAEIAAVRAQVVAANQAVRVTADRLAAGIRRIEQIERRSLIGWPSVPTASTEDGIMRRSRAMMLRAGR